MQRPLELIVTDFNLPEAAAAEIRAQVAKLETFFDRIVGCRVAVEGPGRHLRGQYRVRVDLQVPGHVIVIDRQRGKDLPEAIDEAFKAAGRRLQDCARRMRLEVRRQR